MPDTTVAAILYKDGKFLLVKRRFEPFKGRWCLPGGHIDEFEIAKYAVKREVKEETNLEFEPMFFNYYDEIIRAERWHAVVLAFFGKFKGEEKVASGDVDDIKWFTIDEIKRLHLAFFHKEIIMDFLKHEIGKRNN